MFIQIETTPNPQTLKFLPEREVLESGAMEFVSREAAKVSPLASALLANDGVNSVFFGKDFVSVTKNETSEWAHLKPFILSSILEFFQSGQPLVVEGEVAGNAHADHEGPDSEIVEQIKQLLDTRVRPAVAQDGGDIVFHGFEKGIVYLHMRGACAGCPSATMTLKMGIENLLRHYIPEIAEVRAVA